MNCLDIQKKNTFAPGCGGIGFGDSQDASIVVCPKPRRVGPVINNHMIIPGGEMSHQPEVFSPKVGMELLDLILMKKGCGAEQSAAQIALSPPFFTGSPPTRVANPLIQDARFGEEKLTTLSPLSMLPPPSNLGSPSSSARKGGCGGRVSFGQIPAAVRIEGFDYLNRDSQNSRITAFA